MSVPASGNFSMFGTSNTTIAGAINEGVGASATNGLTKFTQLISASNVSRFHPAGNSGSAITNLNQVTNALQYRNYPSTGITLCFDGSNSFDACSCNASATYYLVGGSSGLTFANGTSLAQSNGTLALPGFYKFGSGVVGNTVVRYWNGEEFNEFVRTSTGNSVAEYQIARANVSVATGEGVYQVSSNNGNKVLDSNNNPVIVNQGFGRLYGVNRRENSTPSSWACNQIWINIIGL